MERKIRDMKFSAILHGADPKELEDKKMPSKSNDLLFGDPEEYKKMDEQSKKELSDKMRSKFMDWARK